MTGEDRLAPFRIDRGVSMKIGTSLVALFWAAAPAYAQHVSQREIDQAIARGLEFLQGAPSTAGEVGANCDELILLAMIHGGSSEKAYDPFLKKVLAAPLEWTYKVSLMAMCLEELDPTLHQNRIAQCAQFLVDSQCKNGQWSYGRATDAIKDMKFEDPPPAKKSVPTPKGGARDFGAPVREHKRPVRAIPVKASRPPPYEVGDNSNSQYAALGLRACFDANIKLPEDVLQLGRRWWVESQCPDESGSKVGADAVSTGGNPAAKVRGWNYTKPGAEGQGPYPSMTAGAVGASVIFDYMLRHDWKKDPATIAGVQWLDKHWSVDTNYYYLYALERAGMLYGTDKIGDHDWYWEGATVIVNDQNPDGSWGHREKKEQNTWDTCFAILFLKKATRGIASVDSRR
jgi:hypothetical protein